MDDHLHLFSNEAKSFVKTTRQYFHIVKEEMSASVAHLKKVFYQFNFVPLQSKTRVLAAFGIIGQESFAEFEKWIKILLSSQNKDLYLICFLLNKKNPGYLKLFWGNLEQIVFTKRKIFMKLLFSKLKGLYLNVFRCLLNTIKIRNYEQFYLFFENDIQN